MKVAIYVTLAVLILGVGTGYAIVPNYLKVTYEEVNPLGTAKIGQLVNARLILNGTTPLPEEARLNISTSVVSPRVEVIINGQMVDRLGESEFEITLPSEGVEEVEIILSKGFTPEVAKKTKVVLLDVKTYVKYKGEKGMYQEDGKLMITVSNIVISGAVEAIDSAKRKLETAEKSVGDLKATGINTASLEAKLKNIEDLLSTAEALYEKEDIELAKSTAESAIKILDEVVFEAGTLKVTKDTKSSLVKYGLIGIVVIVIAGLLLLFMRRREELG